MSELKLMVGDWILRNGIKVKVTPNLLLSLDVSPAFSGTIKPITLTPDVLDRIEGIDKLTSTYRFDKRLFVIRDGIVVDYGSSLTLPHLHTLQQLIRLFTGKEIEVKW